MTTLPHPAAVIWSYPDTPDPVTETVDTITDYYFVDPTESVNDMGQSILTWDEGDQVRGILLPSALVPDGGDMVSSGSGTSVRVRAVDPYDALRMSSAGVPQPVAVIEAEILRGGGALAQELDAAVAVDNTVATLVLETGLGVFVRFSGDWQLLAEDSESLEDLSLVSVAPEALAVFDAADAAGQTVSVFDMPIPSPDTSDLQDTVLYPIPQMDDEQISQDGVITAAGLSIPAIDTADDLPLALRYAQSHPAARWYVAKRAAVLGQKVPVDWLVRTQIGDRDQVEDMVSFDLSSPAGVQAAAIDYLLLLRAGKVADRTELWSRLTRSLIAAARRFELLNDPVIVAALDWRAWMHPRGRDGQFIKAAALIDIFRDVNASSTNKDRRRARVSKLTPEGIQVTYADGKDDVPGYPDLIPRSETKRIQLAPKSKASLSNPDLLSPSPNSRKEAQHDPALLEQYTKELHKPGTSGPLHIIENPDGTYQFTPERQALHDKIIAHFLEGKTPVPQGEQTVFSVLGGGPAAGKSTLQRSGLNPELDTETSNTVLINADEIKDLLPEYNQMRFSDDEATYKNAANFVHEESSYLTQRLTNHAIDGNYDAVLDGTGDSSVASMMRKINAARSKGYQVNGFYATVDTDEAVARMIARGEVERRFVPEEIVRKTHAGVSEVLPLLAKEFDSVSLFDTSERGKAFPIMTGSRGNDFIIQDRQRWQDFLNKAKADD